jgi:PAS domain S-box-containing protein
VKKKPSAPVVLDNSLNDQLKESEKTFRGILNSIEEAIYIQDENGTFLDVNEGAVKMYGYTREELIGKNPLFVSAEDKNDIPKVVEQVKLAFEGIPQAFEFWGKKKNGEIFPKAVRVYKGRYFEKDVVIAVAQDISERKKAEDALRSSELRYRQLVDNSPIGMYRTTPDGRILACNPALMRMLGYTSFEEFSSRNLENVPDSTYSRQDFKERLERDNKITGLEVEWRKKDGTPLFVRENALAVRDENGTILYYDGTAEDITERKQAEKKLKESEELFRNLIENITDVFYISDEQGRMKYCSPNFFVFTGFTPQEILGHLYVRVVAPADRRQVIEHYKNETKRGVLDTNIELRVRRKDGTIFWAEQNTRILRDEKGNVLEYRNVARDITDRKAAEKASKESEEKYRQTFFISPDSVNINRLEDGMYVSINAGFTKIMGFTESEIIGKTSLELDIWVNPEDRKKLVEGLKKDAIVQNLEARFRKKNGEIRFGLMSASILELGGVPHIISITRDITERKQAEEALQKSESKLRAIFTAMPDVILVVDAEGRYLEIAPSDPSLLYKPPSEILGKTMHEIFPKEQADFFLAHIKQSIDTQQPVRMEYTLEIENKTLWFSAILSPLTPDSILLVARDITEKKKAEDALRKSEEWFRNLFEKASDGIFHLSLRGEILSVNSSFAMMHGYTVDEMQKINLKDFDTQEGSQLFPERMRRILAGESLTFEVEHYHKNGHTFPLEVTASLITVGEEKIIMAFHRDITERKKSEDALRKSEERFRLISNLTSDYIFTTKISDDGKAETDWVMGAFEKITGYTLEEYKGIGGWQAVVHPDDREKDLLSFQKLLKNETVISEVRTIRKDGNIVWTRSYAHPVWDEKIHKIIGVYGAVQDITEQKLAEEEIKKLSQAVEQSAGSIVMTDLNGKIEYVNKKFEEVTGYTFEEVKGQNPRILKSGEIPNETYKEMWQTVLAGSEWRGTFHNKRKDGSLYWESTTISPIKNNVGKIINLLAIKDDITKDKLQEELLRKSELHFRTVWESSLDGMRLTDENGIIISVNNAFAKLFKKDKNEIIGKSLAVVYNVDSDFGDVTSYIRHFRERTIQPFIERDITLWNGKRMSVELTNSFVEIEGQPTLLLSIFNDATERVKNDRLLKESNEFNYSLLKNAPFGMNIIDEHGTILFQSDNLKKIIGVNTLGKKCWEIYNENKTQCDNCPLKSEIIVGKTSFFELGNVLGGKTFEAFHTGINFRGRKALLETFVDISERKQAELEITAAKEKAEEANKVKTNFLENMSHELRTPMISILGFTEMMSEMDLPDEVKDMAAMMNKGGNRLMDTLNIILDLSQIEKDRMFLKPTEFNLIRVVDEVFLMFQPIAREKNLYLQKEFLTDTLTVTSDERMLRHAINNLINNGLKFTQNGGVTVKAKLENIENKNFAVIQICDTGVGIPKDKHDIIWEEFRQGSEGMGRSFEGNGLGLTITKNFIEKLNGKVWVESEAGKGSTFTVKLPMDKDSDIKVILVKEENRISEQIPKESLVFGKIQREASGGKIKEEPLKPDQLRKVLYVEDEEISFSVVKHFLKNIVSLDWARNGQDGVVMARGNKYEAILMDINLAKGIDGMQTTKLIRELPQYQQTPIIAITAYAMRRDKEEFLGAGCSHYISKPFTKMALLELMEEVLEKKE